MCLRVSSTMSGVTMEQLLSSINAGMLNCGIAVLQVVRVSSTMSGVTTTSKAEQVCELHLPDHLMALVRVQLHRFCGIYLQMLKVGQNAFTIYLYKSVYGVHTVFLAGKSPTYEPYTVCIYVYTVRAHPTDAVPV